MNIFVLDRNPIHAAQQACDQHVIKMILESAQMLCSAFPKGTAPYKRTHYNHPCSVWARQSLENYQWLLAHAFALAEEYTHRYGKVHASVRVLEWCRDNVASLPLLASGATEFPQAMPEPFQVPGDAVAAYRAFYRGSKSRFAKWTKTRAAPAWWTA